MSETPETADAAGVARRTVLRGTAGLAVGAAAVAAGSEAVASAAQPDAARTIADAERVVAAQVPYLRRKQLWMFKLADVNGDGVVTPDDTMEFALRLVRLTGYAEDSPRAKQLVATVKRIWQGLVAKPAWVPDTERLDAEQFVTVMANSIAQTPDKMMQYIGVVTSLAFAMADTDHDGLISREDAIRLDMEVLGKDREWGEHGWAVLDPDGHGYLGYAECLLTVTDMIISPDPNAPGNLALGRV